MIRRIKKLLKMNKEKDLQITNEQVFEEQVKAREEAEAAADNIDAVEEPFDQYADDPNLEVQMDQDDTTFLETSAEAVGFENRESQWDTYRVMSQYITPEDSILDFGCGRGDFRSFYLSEFETDLTYTGIDFNPQLVDAGKKVNPETNIIHADWKVYEGEADWCISIGSHDVRYDADSVMSDLDYLKNTIKKMYQSCNSGLAIMLASDTLQQDDGIITWSAPDALDYALKEFGTASIDHSYSDALFTLIIYKN